MRSNLIRLALLPAALLACATTLQAAEVTVSAPDSPMLRFALGKLDAALRQQGDVLKRTASSASDPAPGIAVTVDPAALAAIGPEGFRRVRVSQGKPRAVEFALKASVRDADGYYTLTKMAVTAARPTER